ncbi:telomere-protecting terminal protein Tpg [Streptomyces sp. NPDC086989]|uniref:telomere-protecting terminal protein Tpg n=1 Tax=Streptomyces sp. NPDC086989 TaxID=3365764 RepID=UPI0037F415F6
MGKIFDGLRRAVQDKLTPEQRAIPKTAKGQAAALLREEKKQRGEAGAVKRVAARLGITPDSVYRYLSGKRKNPPKQIAQRLEAEVRASSKPRLQKKVIKDAKAVPVKLRTRAEIGYTNSSSGRSTPDGRLRTIAQTLPPLYATPLWQALEDGDEQEAHRIIREYLQNEYIREAGGENAYTEIQLNNIDLMEFEINP